MSSISREERVARAILTERLGAEAAARCEEGDSTAWKDAKRYARAAIAALSPDERLIEALVVADEALTRAVLELSELKGTETRHWLRLAGETVRVTLSTTKAERT